MSSTLKFSGPIRVGKLSSAPANPEEGFIYFDTTDGEFKMYQSGSFSRIVDQSILDNLVATDVAYERLDGSKKNIQAASDDVESALTDLDDGIGSLAASPSNYTPSDATIVADHLAGIDTALGSIASDASEVTYTPTTLTDWDGDADPGNVDGALDQLASRVDTNETSISENTSDIADIRTTQGTSDGDTDLGTFTGSTISDNGSVKAGMQELETAVETKANDADVIKKDGSVAYTGSQSMGGNVITNVADPTNPQDAATKAYVDAIKQGLDIKDSVRVASTANVDLTNASGTGTLDGVTLNANDRVLLKDQTTGSENGIYDVGATPSDQTGWTRTADADADSEVTAGLFTFIEEGTANADTGWVLTTDDPITVDTTALSFTQFTGAGSVTAGGGLTKTGNTLDVNPGDGIQISTDQVAVDSTVTRADGSVDFTADQSMGSNKLTNVANGTVSGDAVNFSQLSAKLENVVEDTTPELGGNLDVNGNDIEGASSEIVLAGQNSVRRAKQASKSNFVEEEYIHGVSLSGSQTDTVIADFTFAHATYEGLEICYKLKEATSGDIRIGTIRVVSNGTNISLNDVSTETADTGITFDAQINGSNVEVTYTSGTNGGTMRADVKKFLT